MISAPACRGSSATSESLSQVYNCRFTAFPSPRRRGDIRQMAGRAGEVWGAESGTDHLVRIGTGG